MSDAVSTPTGFSVSVTGERASMGVCNKGGTSPKIDVGKQRVGRVYAQAFLGAAKTAGKVDQLKAELDSLVVDVLDHFPDLEQVLSSNFISHEDKSQLLDRVFGSKAAPELLAFLKVVSQHDRLDCLRAIRREVQVLYNQLHKRVAVTVTTATPVGPALEQEITARLRTMLGLEPEVCLHLDPNMLAGIIIQVGDTVLDGSVASQLDQLRQQMIETNVAQIEANRQRFLSH